jgi:hypothetical protein
MTAFFHSAINMFDNEDQGARGGQRQPQVDGQQPVIPLGMSGISPEFMMMFQAFQQQSAVFQ